MKSAVTANRAWGMAINRRSGVARSAGAPLAASGRRNAYRCEPGFCAGDVRQAPGETNLRRERGDHQAQFAIETPAGLGNSRILAEVLTQVAVQKQRGAGSRPVFDGDAVRRELPEVGAPDDGAGVAHQIDRPWSREQRLAACRELDLSGIPKRPARIPDDAR